MTPYVKNARKREMETTWMPCMSTYLHQGSPCREPTEENTSREAIQSANGVEWRGKENQEGDYGTEKRNGRAERGRINHASLSAVP